MNLTTTTTYLKSNRLRIIIIIACCAIFLATASTIAYILMPDADQAKYSLVYTVTADPSYGDLSIDMALEIASMPKSRTIPFFIGQTDGSWHGCTDEAGNEIPFTVTGELLEIGPIENGASKLNFKYDARIGMVSESVSGIPYAQGSFFEDLLTFSGEFAFILPYTSPDLLDSIGKYIGSVQIEFITPEGWQSIIPYNTPLDGSRSLYVDKPTWDFFNSISKSAFCFGHFERLEYRGATASEQTYDGAQANEQTYSGTQASEQAFDGTLAFEQTYSGTLFNEQTYSGTLASEQIYVDVAIADSIPQNTLDTLAAYFAYYTSLFGRPLDGSPIVLLRNHPYDYSVIVGGVGSRGSAISAGMRFIDDYKALSNTLYHTYFDSIIKTRNLRYVTGNWIYAGLADYYVNLSSGLLPEEVKNDFNISHLETFEEKYLKYLYFSLKEPGFLVLNPADEQFGMYTAQKEYYFGVKTPIIIDAINYTISQKTGLSDGFIKRLAEIGTDEKPLDFDDLLKEICGSDYKTILMFFSGRALVPNYKNANINDMPNEDIVDILDSAEQAYSYWFNADRVFYPYARIELLNESALFAEADRLNARYNTDNIQEEVKAFSNVLHRLLLQYALRAKLAGVDDITVPNIHEQIFEASATEKWNALCEEIGYETGTTQ